MGSLLPAFNKMKFALCSALLVGAVSLAAGQLIKFNKAKEAYNNVKSRLQCAEMPNNGTCAILFDEDDCTGWQLAVNEGYTELPSQGVTDFLGGSFIDKPKKDDAEAVLVRNGCMFIGYQRAKDSSRGLGDAVIITAIDGHRYQNLDTDGFKQLDEKIDAVDCKCTGFAFSKQTLDRRKAKKS